ncbi:MAG: DUF58 domain-containing protein [Candidatus Marinimicrobia bacterium]|nr:DUF58 domain-containing protein [Candidatus Neomarinimicrobiota bacterium]
MANLSTTYLNPQIVSQLNNLSLRARLVVEGFIAGLHRSPYHGFSVEFAEHRAYGPGDEIRHVDWKLYGKTDRYYVKQFEEETNLKCYLLVDQSRSMDFDSHGVSKLTYAQTLAASLAYLMLKQQDAVGLALFDGRLRHYLPPRAKPSHLNTVLGYLARIKPGPETTIAPVLHQLAETIVKRGLIILISDLFDDPQEVLLGLRHLRHKQHEVVVFHLLDPQELEFSFSRRTRFRDMETGEVLTTEPWHIQQEYNRYMQEFIERYRRQCRQQNIDYLQITTNQPLDRALSEYLIKRRHAA